MESVPPCAIGLDFPVNPAATNGDPGQFNLGEHASARIGNRRTILPKGVEMVPAFGGGIGGLWGANGGA